MFATTLRIPLRTSVTRPCEYEMERVDVIPVAPGTANTIRGKKRRGPSFGKVLVVEPVRWRGEYEIMISFVVWFFWSEFLGLPFPFLIYPCTNKFFLTCIKLPPITNLQTLHDPPSILHPHPHRPPSTPVQTLTLLLGTLAGAFMYLLVPSLRSPSLDQTRDPRAWAGKSNLEDL